MRRTLAILCGLLLAGAVGAEEISPEVQLCLLHLRPSERARAREILGPWDELPLYVAELDVDPRSREVTGKARVRYAARGHELSSLPLRVTPDAFDAGRVRVFNATLNGQPAPLQRPEPALYRVALDPPVAVGAAAVVEVGLKAKAPVAPKDAGSLVSGGVTAGNSDHGAFMASPDFISLVGLLPQVPAADESGALMPGPSGVGDLALYEPAHYLVSVTVPRGWRVHATGGLVGEVPEPSGKVRFTYAAAATRDFPLFVSRGYEVATAKVEDVVVESHFAAADAAAGRKVLGYAVSAMAELQKRLGPLPYTRFRVVEAPLTGGAGGMEFPGLVTVGSGLYRSGDPLAALGVADSAQVKGLLAAAGLSGALANLPDLGAMLENMLEFTVAHEVAHQYFAGLVGSDPVNAPVVDEALAQYTALLYIEWKHGKKAADTIRDTQVAGGYQMHRMMGGHDAIADRPTSAFSSGMEYAAIVYGKAPLLHAEERKLLGDAAFLKGLRAYVDAYRFRWACRDCLTQVLAKQSPAHAAKLRALRRRWWEETHGDEDLGGGDAAGLLSRMGGQQLDPETQKLLEELLPQLLGTGTGGP